MVSSCKTAEGIHAVSGTTKDVCISAEYHLMPTNPYISPYFVCFVLPPSTLFL